VLAQLHSGMNVTIVLWTVLSDIVFLISLLQYKYLLCTSTIFLCLRLPSSLEMSFQMILLLYPLNSLDLSILMDNSIRTFLNTLLNSFRMCLHCLLHPVLKVEVMVMCLQSVLFYCFSLFHSEDFNQISLLNTIICLSIWLSNWLLCLFSNLSEEEAEEEDISLYHLL
jgi:hypothetical protein